MKKVLCEVCEIGHVLPNVEQYSSIYKGQSGHVLRHSHVCNHCGGDYAFDSDAKKNKREIIRFRKTIDLVPFGCEIRDMRIAADLTQAEAGHVFGGGPVAFSKYESDDLVPNESMIRLLKLAIQDLSIVERLRALNGVHVSFVAQKKSLVDSGFHAGDVDWMRELGEATETIASRDIVMNAGSFLKEKKWTQ